MIPRASSRLARIAGPLLLTLAVSGCLAAQAPADDLAGWQAKPLAPDPALAQHALQQVACRSGRPGDFAVRILLQDRRTASTAAFIVAGEGFSGSCMVSIAGGSAGGGGTTDPREPLVGPMVVDERSAGSLGDGFATLLGGRVVANAASVLVDLPDGRTVEASVGGGYWLAWWPAESEAVRVRALDAAGEAVATLDASSPGWQPR